MEVCRRAVELVPTIAWQVVVRHHRPSLGHECTVHTFDSSVLSRSIGRCILDRDALRGTELLKLGAF